MDKLYEELYEAYEAGEISESEFKIGLMELGLQNNQPIDEHYNNEINSR